MASDIEGFVGDLLAATNNHDVEALVACFAEDYVNVTPAHPARGFVGRDQVRRNWTTIFGAVPDLTASISATAASGDDVWTEWEMDGTRRDGVEHHMRGVIVFTVRGRQTSAARFFLEPMDVVSGDVNAAISRAFAQETAQ